MPTIYDQQKGTYNDQNIQIRIVSDAIRVIDPVDTPLIVALGGLDAARQKFNVRQDGKLVELLEDEYGATSDTFNGAVATTTTTTVTVTDGSKFQVGHIVSWTQGTDTEYAWVSAVSGQDLTVTRGYGGTQTTSADANTVNIVGMARLEGADAAFIGLNEVAIVSNYTQIFQKALNVSGSDEAIDYYGMGSPFAYQALKAVPELTRLVEQNLFHGQKKVGSKTTPRGAGGLGTFMGSNTVAAGGAITKADVDDLMEKIHIDGGMPDLLVVHPSIAADLKDIIDSSSFVRVDQSENKLGLGPLQYADTQFGSLRIVMDRWCPSATAYVLDSKKCGLFTLRPFNWKPLAITGDSKKGEVLGEFSLLVANNEAHGTITGITT
jgi:hypothetical protein